MKFLLKVIREKFYNDRGKFKGIYVIGSSFRDNLPPFSPETCQINNDLTMDLMKSIFEYTGIKGPVTANTVMLRSKAMIGEDEYIMIDNGIRNYDNSLQPGLY